MAYTDGKDRSHFVHGVTVRVLRNVQQGRSSWQLVANFVHDEIGELLHTFGRASEANKLKRQF